MTGAVVSLVFLYACSDATRDEPLPTSTPLAGAGGEGGAAGAGLGGRGGAAGAAGPGGSGGAAGAAGASGQAGAAGGGGAKLMPPPFVVDPDARTRLSEAGFFADVNSTLPSAELVTFEPRFPFWSDGADKKRWLWLPPGTKVDASDVEHWRFPIGTRVYKEFALDGKRLETRLIERTGEGPFDYWMGSFVWLEDQSDAVFAKDGAVDVLGTGHDVPEAKVCFSCHVGEPGRLLGFSAMQLEGSPVKALGLIEPPPPAAPGPPGDAVARAAFGYLHANCGFCHYDGGIAWSKTNMILRLGVGETTTVEATEIYGSTVGVPVQFFQEGGLQLRVDGGAPETSALTFRMSYRGDDRQMPPIASEL
ncbi:MAG TPA: hypothetical protein VFS00_27730, partial [Polyangiaceae bacterium]|nr:hypothetical protein [Polyangiaceae bacterium]